MDRIKVVFDYDGPLHDLVGAVCGILGIDKSEWVHYGIRSNTHWSVELQDRITELCQRADTFKVNGMRIEAKRLKEIEDTGKAEVWIHTVCWSHEVADVKHEIINSSLNWLPEDRVIIEVLGVDERKSVLEDIGILVEDCAKNLNKSKATDLNVFMELDNVKQQCFAKHMTVAHDLDEAIDTILRYLESK